MNSYLDPPKINLDQMNKIDFVEQYNADIDFITEDMVKFLQSNGVSHEWLVALLQELYLCNLVEDEPE